MSRKAFPTLTDQVTDLLRQGMFAGRWKGTLPGRESLAAELGCSHWTIEEAMRRLAREGLLASQGAGKKRRIIISSGPAPPRPLLVKILLYEKSDRRTDYLVELLHLLKNAGHEAGFADNTMRGLDMSLQRITKFAEATQADAWVVVAGPRNVLDWFAKRETPAFALFGRSLEVAMASAALVKADAYAEVVRQLVGLGHRRIVNIVREDRRKPTPSFLDQFFLEQLAKHGIPTGPYNLPDWEDTPEGLQKLLDALFQHTPPTAMLLDEPALFHAAKDHLARKGFHAPGDVSLVCCDPDPTLEWFRPSITHIGWDAAPLIRRVVQWTNHISRGKDDRRKTGIKAKLVSGGTIGPVPSARRP